MGIEFKKDPFGRGTDIFDGLMRKGRIDANNDIYNIYGRKTGKYLGGNQVKDIYGVTRKLVDHMKFF